MNHTYSSAVGSTLYNYFYLDVELKEKINIENIKLYFNGYDRVLSEGANIWISTNGFSPNVVTTSTTTFFESQENKITIAENELPEYIDTDTYYKGGCELDIHNYIDYKEISIPPYEYEITSNTDTFMYIFHYSCTSIFIYIYNYIFIYVYLCIYICD